MSHSAFTLATAYRTAVYIRNNSSRHFLQLTENYMPAGELLPRLSDWTLSNLVSERLVKLGWFAAMYLLSVLSFGALVVAMRWALNAIQAV